MRVGNWKPSKGRKARVKCLLKTTVYSCDCYKIVSLVYISLICLYLWPLPTMFRIINIQYYLVFICADGKDGNTTLYPGVTRFQWFYGFLPLKYMCIIAWRYSMLIRPLVGGGGGTRISSLLKYYI